NVQVFSQRGMAELAADKVVDVDLGGPLAMTVDTPVALLQAIGIPGDFVVNEAATMALQVDALAGGIRCQQDPHLRFTRVCLASGLDSFGLFGFHAPVQR